MALGLLSFVNRHKNKLFIATGLSIAGAYMTYDFISGKISEWGDNMAEERIGIENLRRRFEQNQIDAYGTTVALLPSLTDPIIEEFPVEDITRELQAKRGTRSISTSGTPSSSDILPATNGAAVFKVSEGKSKIQLWNDLKLQSITRIFVLIYSSALLLFLTRLQLNIIGRTGYVTSVVNIADQKNNKYKQPDTAAEQPSDGPINLDSIWAEEFEREITDTIIDEEELATNRMYLTFSWWLLNKGRILLKERVEKAVAKVFEPINPRTELSLLNFVELIDKVRFIIENKPNTDSDDTERTTPYSYLENLLPPSTLEHFVLKQIPKLTFDQGNNDDEQVEITPTLRTMLDETADFIESPIGTSTMKDLVSRGISIFVDSITAIHFKEELENQEIKVEELTESSKSSAQTIKLASLLATITRQAHRFSESDLDNIGEANSYIDLMNDSQELQGFGAVVYSNWN
ncbi:Peroxin-3 [Nadsonia fulvescens var. elongata DSM 6958]|uniref:Peroxin-3 n=1 Tax=Nadsonia fulvescens var. elongata DSM 6958 TaxID=857566 RepID=A0A1E3PDJ3_9ASCO|nr:Peroxin-3 [Nadsonia fulvescens var. elongata DSM 6958]